MKYIFIIAFLCFSSLMYSQDTEKDIFKRITTAVEKFTVDTTAVPEDKLTEHIRKLRETKGGFNINEAILYKITEDRNKKDITAEEAAQLEDFILKGKGKVWLENAVIWIYRKHFSLSEIKALTRFYSSSAGKKFSYNFPIIMIESFKSAEKIIEKYKSEAKR